MEGRRECTRCGDEKRIEEFEKGKGGKYTTRCKQCASKYSIRRKKEKNKLQKSQTSKDTPLFEMKLVAEHVLNTKVQRSQVVMLPGEIDKFVKVSCPCGISINLEYRYSYDAENDYYEGVCNTCGRSFKQTITDK